MVIQQRYKLLRLPGIHFIPPFHNEFIDYLYDAYRGKIRFIMEAINTLAPFLAKNQPKTLPLAKARTKLQEILHDEIMDLLVFSFL